MAGCAPWRKLPLMEGCANEEVSLVIDDDDIAACDAHAIEADRDKWLLSMFSRCVVSGIGMKHVRLQRGSA